MNIPVDDIGGFFRYNWFISHLQDKSMEWDSLVIIPQSKMIINIEVKKNAKGFNSLIGASKRAKIHLNTFKKIFESILSAEWTIVKAVSTIKLELNQFNQPCDDCKQFILQEHNYLDMKPWIQRQVSICRKYTKESYEIEYDNLCIGIVRFSIDYLNKIVVNPNEFSIETEIKLTGKDSAIQVENEEVSHKLRETYEQNKLCYKLTDAQLMAVKDPSSHMIIEGDYGCGKTYVLKERTKQYAEKYPKSKIAYINITADPSYHTHVTDMMDIIAENNFKDNKYNNVDVVAFMDLYGHYSKHKDELKDVTTLFGSSGEECSLVIKHFLE